jgi:hypothetical protein
MQNYNNTQTPPGGYGPPQPPAKKRMSTGVKVLIVVVLVGVVGVAVLIVAGVGGYFWLRHKAGEVASVSSTTRAGLAGSGSTRSAGGNDGAEAPQPTEAQSAAVAGGQSATWEQQEISWTVPQKWKKNTADSTTLMWRSPGTWDAASLIVNISPMSGSFPTDISLKAFYEQAQTRKQNGEVDEVRWLKIDGVKGVMFHESAPENGDNPQRLQWMGYRNYKGQTQLVNIMLASRGKDFARHEDAMYGILYSTQLTK